MSYGQLLRHPLWQRKRLEIMSRDNFKCVACGSGDRTLHVHHIMYKGKPWECSNQDMQTLCDRCHLLLPEHPIGGVFYELEHNNEYGHILHLGFRYCLICGNNKPASHSGCVLFECGHLIDSIPQSMIHNWAGVQGKSPSGYESQWFYSTKGGDA